LNPQQKEEGHKNKNNRVSRKGERRVFLSVTALGEITLWKWRHPEAQASTSSLLLLLLLFLPPPLPPPFTFHFSHPLLTQRHRWLSCTLQKVSLLEGNCAEERKHTSEG